MCSWTTNRAPVAASLPQSWIATRPGCERCDARRASSSRRASKAARSSVRRVRRQQHGLDHDDPVEHGVARPVGHRGGPAPDLLLDLVASHDARKRGSVHGSDVRTAWYDGACARLLPLAWLALAAARPLPAAERFEIRFGEHLGLADLRLAGGRATRQVEFSWPMDWRPLSGAELRLRFEHSPALDGERSFLALTLNHGVLRSLRLDAHNAGPTDLVVPLAPEMLREENQLVISVEQFTTAGGADAEWTLVRSASLLSIPFERRRVERSLADLPEPILERHSFEPRRLTVLLPSRPS